MSDTARDTFVTAAALALGAAISLGLARFSYALLLPPMRADLGWSYFTAGAMNTFNAAGYLVGALLLPRALARFDARTLLLAGGFGTALVLAAHGLVRSDAWLYSLRALAGVCSAATFATGGLLAARLGQAPGAKPALVLGLYYGGTGLGIIASALIVPPLSWPGAWVALAMAALLGSGAGGAGTRSWLRRRRLRRRAARVSARATSPSACSATLMFGLGYIGYMTFIVTLLREQGVGGAVIVAFYVLLGAGVIASSWLWAPLLQRYRGGQPLAVLDALLAVATLLPVLSAHPVAVFASGALFGARVPVGGGVDHGPGAPQPAAGGLAGGHRRLHHRLRGRADRRPGARRLGGRRPRRPRARSRVVGRRAGVGRAAGVSSTRAAERAGALNEAAPAHTRPRTACSDCNCSCTSCVISARKASSSR
jgi:predicted MFS family arabinose efflux permease